MKKFICRVCGYVYEGEEAPEKCPQCGAPKDKFDELKEGVKEYADEHVVGMNGSWKACASISPVNAPKWACTWP